MKRWSSVLAVTLALAACPRPASSKLSTRDAAATAAATDASRSTDGSIQADVAMPAGFDGLSPEGRRLLRSLQHWLHAGAWQNWRVSADGPHRKQRLAWLAKDFKAPVFRRAERLDEAVFTSPGDRPVLHLGFILVRFAKCKQLAQAQARIAKAGRLNFALPVLTMFRIRARGHSLTFVLSETPLRPEIESLFGTLDKVIGPTSACLD